MLRIRFNRLKLANQAQNRDNAEVPQVARQPATCRHRLAAVEKATPCLVDNSRLPHFHFFFGTSSSSARPPTSLPSPSAPLPWKPLRRSQPACTQRKYAPPRPGGWRSTLPSQAPTTAPPYRRRCSRARSPTDTLGRQQLKSRPSPRTRPKPAAKPRGAGACCRPAHQMYC